jgi:hypothetical protein
VNTDSLYVIIALLIGIIFIIGYTAYQIRDVKKYKIESVKKRKISEFIFTGVFMVLIILILIGCFTLALPEPDEEEYRVIDSIPIVSLKLDKEVHASFFLGIGGISGSQSYKFYKITEHNTLKFTQIPASNIEIYRSDEEPPALKTYQRIKRYTVPWKIYLKGEEVPIINDTYQVLIIPTNAIEVKYDANL